MDKKLKARSEMIRKLAKEKASDLPELGKGLASKKMSKVEVIAKDEKGLEEGLSKAQQILKAKLGKKMEEFEEPTEEDTEASDLCADCGEALEDGHPHHHEEDEEESEE